VQDWKRRTKKKNELTIGIRNAEIIGKAECQNKLLYWDKNWFKKDEIMYELNELKIEMILKYENESRIR
jgi:hypothetical protein